MTYDSRGMSRLRATSLLMVALIHVVLGYGVVLGLRVTIIPHVAQRLTVFDVNDEVPPPAEPPPPAPPQPPTRRMYVPPAVVHIDAPMKLTAVELGPSFTIVPPPPPPPVMSLSTARIEKPVLATPARARGDPAQWVTANDYPLEALREQREGVTGIEFAISAEGRVIECRTGRSSGSIDLDRAACEAFSRRARYTPARDLNGVATATAGMQRIRWQMP